MMMLTGSQVMFLTPVTLATSICCPLNNISESCCKTNYTPRKSTNNETLKLNILKNI